MSQRVLIADDEPNIVVSLEFMMKRAGYEVLIARDGLQALDMIRRERPRLVLLDGMMPGLSGFEVCEAVRADDALADTKIVMLTAKGRDTDVARGVGAGADAYVVKPFSTRDLVDMVYSAVPASLLESALFGHEKGAFTGAVTARAGVFERIFERLSDAPDFEYALVDGTIVSAHQKASGAKGGLRSRPSVARAVA